MVYLLHNFLYVNICDTYVDRLLIILSSMDGRVSTTQLEDKIIIILDHNII